MARYGRSDPVFTYLLGFLASFIGQGRRVLNLYSDPAEDGKLMFAALYMINKDPEFIHLVWSTVFPTKSFPEELEYSQNAPKHEELLRIFDAFWMKAVHRQLKSPLNAFGSLSVREWVSSRLPFA